MSLIHKMLVALLCTAIARGIVSAFGLDLKVAALIREAMNPQWREAVAWILSGTAGLIVLALWETRPTWLRLPGQIKPNMRINDAVDYIVNDSRKKFPPPRVMELGGILVPARGSRHHNAATWLNERLASGEFETFGYREILPQPGPRLHEDIRRKIEVEYWRVAQLHPLNCSYFTKKLPQTFVTEGPHSGHPAYYELMMNKSQVFRAFPRKALWRRFLERSVFKTKRITYHP